MYEDEDYEDEDTETKKIVDSELVKEARVKLEQMLGKDHKSLNRLLDDFVSNAAHNMGKTLQEHTRLVVEELWQKHLQAEGQKYIEECFKAALEEMVVVEEQTKYVQKKCQEVVLSQVKSFLASNWDSEKRRDKVINASIDDIISGVVESRVDSVLQEIKAEAIEKFNKQAMKLMMTGMAREIGSDKKLLALLTE